MEAKYISYFVIIGICFSHSNNNNNKKTRKENYALRVDYEILFKIYGILNDTSAFNKVKQYI